MIETMRWFGPNDPVPLTYIRQAGASGIVTAMHDIPLDRAWTAPEVRARREMIEEAGLDWTVVESIPVAEEIKATGTKAGAAVETWLNSLRAVAEAGIETVCYNFSIGVDWVRTDTEFTLPNGAQALRFDATAFAAFDLFILQRPGAEADYLPERIEAAERAHVAMTEAERQRLTEAIVAGLPGSMIGAVGLDAFREKLASYEGLTNDGIRQNLIDFQSVIVPEAERLGVDLCIHPNDPPKNLFGLPLAVSTPEDFKTIFEANPSPANGLTWCLGSLSVGAAEDAIKIGRTHSDRIRFAHLRVVQKDESDADCFEEAEHLAGEVSLIEAVEVLLTEEDRRASRGAPKPIPMRPDHGHRIADDLTRTVNPGYSFYGRLKGLAELRGAAAALLYTRATV
ncbi:mannonate dehydratase [Jannaschia seohaensis]|uniref:Mannonate dehydratase n=1 Tax=Jannaschia seohaensis TaxID=475081 RepID=A0A2Y9B4F6_9RHOB|nr:mannonate dehydratase [Jannaschia seohaensis]PWJ13865.1 mannonate dehydratase [Jannaschia seohaensis]SSA50378.1 mannonate dehydratase [Jannaschia seohaensis]